MTLLLIISALVMVLAVLTKVAGYVLNRNYPATVQITKEGIRHNG